MKETIELLIQAELDTLHYDSNFFYKKNIYIYYFATIISQTTYSFIRNILSSTFRILFTRFVKFIFIIIFE